MPSSQPMPLPGRPRLKVPGALLNRQPTPGSIAAAESRLGEISQELMATLGTGMARAREADLAGDQSTCEEALAAVRRAISQ